jgi:probable HAF family extracellular repeat protein
MKTKLVSAILIMICLAATAKSETRYIATDLGTLGGASSSACAINASGQITGHAYASNDDVQHVFLYSGGVMQDLGKLPGYTGNHNGGKSINNSGVIVGYGGTPHWRALTWNSTNGLQEFAVPGERPYNFAWGINDAGHIIATNEDYFSGKGSVSSDAYLFRNGNWTTIPAIPGGSHYAEPQAINNHDQVVGFGWLNGDYRGFAWDEINGTRALSTLGGTESTAVDISDGGLIVGYAQTAYSETHAVLWSGSSITDLGTIGGTASYAAGINNNGLIVGYAYTAGDVVRHGFVYSDGVMHDLNNLIDPSLGWTLNEATAINDNGWITGYGINADGQTHAFILTPTPEPATLLLLTIGGLILRKRNYRLH